MEMAGCSAAQSMERKYSHTGLSRLTSISTGWFLTRAHLTCWPWLMVRRLIHRMPKLFRNPNGAFSNLWEHTYTSTTPNEDWIRLLPCSSPHILPLLWVGPHGCQCLWAADVWVCDSVVRKFNIERTLGRISQGVLYSPFFCFMNIVFESSVNPFHYSLSLGTVRYSCLMKDVITVTE